ncbi:DUF1415 domain-containing protein [Ramlibacter sp.]|uniref:DUF1415 domain-containing protein n=1 Tax=Ramlibacter sp. TaxID=1917967 RepID=UPI003D0B9D93
MEDAACAVERDTRAWLERAVIGLNLCPFAKAVYAKGQVHLAVSGASDAEEALRELETEAAALVALAASVRDTTLLVVPGALDDFLEFDGAVKRGERMLRKRGYEGVLQLASFHPRFEFAGSEPGDAANRTNRSPYPMLHLLREESIDRAVEAFPDAAAIYERNIETLERLGDAGWAALGVGRSA